MARANAVDASSVMAVVSAEGKVSGEIERTRRERKNERETGRGRGNWLQLGKEEEA